MQSFVAEAFTAGRFREAAYDAYEAARGDGAGARDRHHRGDFSRLRQRRRRAVARRAGRPRRPHVGRQAFCSSCSTPCSARARSASCRKSGTRSSQAAGAAARIGELLAVRPQIAAPAAPLALPSPARGELAFRFGRLRLSGPNGGRSCCATSASASRRARSSPSSARPERASRRSSSCCCASTIPTRGAVTLDGVDIAKARSQALARARSRSCRRTPFIFGASVADNIAYGAPNASREAIVAAAKQAAADGFITALPQGYDTLHRRARRDAVGRRAPAARHRPRDPEGRAGPAARRGDLGARRRKRNAGAGRARGADAGPHDAGHRPPAGDHRQRRTASSSSRPAASSRREPTPRCSRRTASMRALRACSSRPAPRR